VSWFTSSCDISAPFCPTHLTSAWSNRLLAYPHLSLIASNDMPRKKNKQWPLYSLLSELVQAPGYIYIYKEIPLLFFINFFYSYNRHSEMCLLLDCELKQNMGGFFGSKIKVVKLLVFLSLLCHHIFTCWSSVELQHFFKSLSSFLSLPQRYVFALRLFQLL